jgi:hyperosmotically inducible protein
VKSFVRYVRERTEGSPQSEESQPIGHAFMAYLRRTLHMKTRFGPLVLNAALVSSIALMAVGCSKTVDLTDTPPPGTTIGTELDDSVVTTRVKSALLADPNIKSIDFKVDTRKGVVQLSGFVDNQTQSSRAVTVARAVEGVKDVQNNVSLKGEATTVGNKLDGSIITTKVKTALLADENVKSFDIAVVTRKDEVQLSGFVNNQNQMDRAISVARAVDGVRDVKNEMSIKK